MKNDPVSKETTEKLSMIAYVICGWPLALIAIGGAIGGGLGGAACGINVAIYKSPMSAFSKIILNVLAGATAFVVWAVMANLIQNPGG